MNPEDLIGDIRECVQMEAMKPDLTLPQKPNEYINQLRQEFQAQREQIRRLEGLENYFHEMSEALNGRWNESMRQIHAKTVHELKQQLRQATTQLQRMVEGDIDLRGRYDTLWRQYQEAQEQIMRLEEELGQARSINAATEPQTYWATKCHDLQAQLQQATARTAELERALRDKADESHAIACAIGGLASSAIHDERQQLAILTAERDALKGALQVIRLGGADKSGG